jgi:predicted transcriptional regulator of viral defense system
MTAKEKLLEYAKEKKIFRARDAEDALGGASPRVYLQRLAREGKLVKMGYGLYQLAEGNFSEMQDILEVAVKVPKGVLCLLSALRFHDLTTQNPFEVWLAIENGMRIPKVETVPVKFFRFAPNVYQTGIETHRIEGVEVKVYSAAKTVADCFRYQSTVGFDVAMEALREVWAKRKATMDELYHFADVRNIKKKMLPYLRTLN